MEPRFWFYSQERSSLVQFHEKMKVLVARSPGLQAYLWLTGLICAPQRENGWLPGPSCPSRSGQLKPLWWLANHWKLYEWEKLKITWDPGSKFLHALARHGMGSLSWGESLIFSRSTCYLQSLYLQNSTVINPTPKDIIYPESIFSFP